jgi:thiamine pyrophosphate-dependent acetolactate synthase large subunit-like protein
VLTRDELLAPLARLRADRVVVTTMGMVRPWARYSQTPLDFASADSAMAHAADFALGVALARPERQVLCLNGDGSMLMSLGTLVTVVDSGARNLALFVVDNGTYEVTGNQRIPGAGRVDFAALARAAGFPTARRFDQAAAYESALPGLLSSEVPVFAVVGVEPGREGPLGRGPDQQAPYLRPSLADSARELRRALAGPAAPSGSGPAAGPDGRRGRR